MTPTEVVQWLHSLFKVRMVACSTHAGRSRCVYSSVVERSIAVLKDVVIPFALLLIFFWAKSEHHCKTRLGNAALLSSSCLCFFSWFEFVQISYTQHAVGSLMWFESLKCCWRILECYSTGPNSIYFLRPKSLQRRPLMAWQKIQRRWHFFCSSFDRFPVMAETRPSLVKLYKSWSQWNTIVNVTCHSEKAED